MKILPEKSIPSNRELSTSTPYWQCIFYRTGNRVINSKN